MRWTLATKINAAVIVALVFLGITTAGTAIWDLQRNHAEEVLQTQAKNARIAAALLARAYPDQVSVSLGQGAEAPRVEVSAFPDFPNHRFIDEIAAVTQQTVTVFQWDEVRRDFVRRTTNIKKENGSRAVGTVLGQNGAVYPVMMQGRTYRGEAVILGKPYFTQYTPIYKQGARQPVGILYVGLEKAKYDEALWTALLKNLTILVGLILVITVGAFFFVRRLVSPFGPIKAAILRLAKRELDAEIPFKGRTDEIGQIADGLEELRVAAQGRKRQAELDAARQQRELEEAARINKAVAAFEREIGEIVGTVSSASTELLSAADNMHAAADSASRDASTVSQAAEQAAEAVSSVASATEELTGTINEIASRIHESAAKTKEAESRGNETSTNTRQLREQANSIGSVIELIDDISDQTNLLALNATIEAARAGEAGKGFAVVATEVKSLASQTGRATSEISEKIDRVLGVTETSVGSVEEMVDINRQLAEIASSVSAAMEQQIAATAEISRNIANASSNASEVSNTIVNVSAGAQQTSSSATQVTQSARELSQQSERLSAMVGTFLEEVRRRPTEEAA